MSRTSERPPPSSPADRYESPLQRRSTTPVSVDHEKRIERRTAHLWGHTDSLARDPSPDRRQEREDRSFEDFQPADPLSRLNSSERSPESARSSGATAITAATSADDARRASSHKADYSGPRDSVGSTSQPGQMLDASGNQYPDLDRQVGSGSQWQDWAPGESRSGGSAVRQQDSHARYSIGHGSASPPSQDNSAGKTSSSGKQSSTGQNSKESVESYHAALQKLNSSKTNDGPGAKPSIARWLRGQRRKPNLSLAELESKQFTKGATWPASPPVMPNTPNHVSTFQPADEYRYLDSRSLTSQGRPQSGDREDRRVSIIPETSPTLPSSPPKELKRSFFGSLGSAFGSSLKAGPKDQSKHQARQLEQLEQKRNNWERRLSLYSHGSERSMKSGKSGRDEEPFGQAAPLGFTPNKSSRRGRTGYFSRQKRSSEGGNDAPVKGPYVGFSRRTEQQESPQTPSMGGGRLKTPEPFQTEQESWLRTRRPRLNRSSSSAHSPCDTSARAMAKPAAHHAWETHLDPKNSPRFDLSDTPNRPPPRLSNNPRVAFSDVPFEFNGPADVPKSMQPPPIGVRPPMSGYLPFEAHRVPTILEEPRLRGQYLWESWLSHTIDRSSEMNSTRDSHSDQASVNTRDQWHTPFPAPNDASISNTVAKGSETGDRDWYRIRMDQAAGDEDKPKDIEDLRMFEWDLPEHLPSSPLCPLNPKHSSKGKGVCVYHGRKKKGGVGTSKNAANGGLAPNDLGVGLWK